MPTVLSDVSNILTNVYHPRLESSVFKKTILLDQLEKGTGMEPMQNNTFRVKVRSSGHSGVYFRAVGGTGSLTIGRPSYQEPSIAAATGYGTHDILDYALTAAKGRPGAIADLAGDFAASVQQELRRSMNRQFCGLGGSATNNAKVADVNGAVSGTTVILDGFGTRFLYVGSVLDIGTEAEHVAGTAEAVTVSTIDSSTNFTATASETLVDNDLVKFSGAHDNEMDGLVNAISASGTYMGITMSSNYWLHSYVDSTNEVLTEEDMVQALGEADKKGDVRFIATGFTLYRKYAALLSSLKRAVQDKALLGGFVGLEFAAGKPGVGVFLEHDIRYEGASGGDMFFVTPQALSIGKLDMGWLESPGGGIFQKRDLIPSYWATYKFYGNLATIQPGSNARLSGKTN